jgi:hypothetical protein
MAWVDWFVKYLPLIYLLITAGLVLGLLKSKNFIRPAVIVVIGLELIKAGLLIFGTYYLWSHNNISKFLLPPHRSLSYFISYVSYRFILPLAFTFLAALLVFFAVKFINRLFQERLFYSDEPGFIFYGIIITGYPLWVFYLFAILALAILFYLVGLIFKKWKFGELFSLRYLWLAVSFLTLFCGQIILRLPLLYSLKF